MEGPGGIRPQPPRPADAKEPFPSPPTLPEKYWQKGETKRWDAIWVGAKAPEFNTMPVVQNCSKILDHLCVGNYLFACNKEALEKEGITHILTLTRRCPPPEVRTTFCVLQVVVNDTPQTSVSEYFEEAVRHIIQAEQSGGKVFVHCRAGVSRASTFVIAYLIKARRMTVESAYELIKKHRPIAHPNKGFLQQLLKLEEETHGQVTSRFTAEMLPYTLWERVEMVGLNEPLPSCPLCHELERRVAAGFVERHGSENTYKTMDAGLGGKLELHVVGLFSVCDFEWLDPIIVEVLYSNRPPDGNYVPKRRDSGALLC